jgi:hypothetical protein
MIILGIFLCFFGNHFLKAVIFTISAIVISFGTAYAAFSISEHLTKGQTQDWTIWIILVVSILIGVGCGSYLMYCIEVGKCIIAGCGGVALGNLITHSLMVDSQILYWGIIIACVVAAVAVTIMIKDQLVIITTAFIGAYSLVRGISLFAGGYPSEFTLQ